MIRAIARRLVPGRVRHRIWEWWSRSSIDRAIDRWAQKRFHRAVFLKTGDAISVRWLGRQVWQYPLDAWLTQEVIAELRPDLIVETGTFLGGSAYYYASLCDLLGHGEVISIDIAPQGTIPHPRISYVTGSSTDPRVVENVLARIRAANVQRMLVVLDSDHSARHVLAELAAFAPLVPVGSYIHVQDGCIDEVDWYRESGRPGPLVAVKEFLVREKSFVRDLDVERRYLSMVHPFGWLKRVTT